MGHSAPEGEQTRHQTNGDNANNLPPGDNNGGEDDVEVKFVWRPNWSGIDRVREDLSRVKHIGWKRGRHHHQDLHR